jgi:hypothetical protein
MYRARFVAVILTVLVSIPFIGIALGAIVLMTDPFFSLPALLGPEVGSRWASIWAERWPEIAGMIIGQIILMTILLMVNHRNQTNALSDQPTR